MGQYWLEREIEITRARMEQMARELGFTHPAVVKISQQLDELLNQWNESESLESQGVYIIRRYTSRIREVAVGRA
ncbi:Spo0E family sporulation regulatory protein-aspartic acid phosphatase [Salinithrix halophila]|uniref:Spo0E family sporulation regulatory protein-aspartic acid phosphatase n=1 Tax=Salinithrix halophila TaxID=1485204 RepID=A0ABV8JFG9_9BACL